ncbi:electron transfer flavoprotein subunit beta/FixA family protein [Kytococcus sp. Marseille-QA3725]
MNIVVCVKHVPDAQGDRSFGDDSLTDRSTDGLLSELDEYAVEEALKITEASGDGRVTVLTMGPADAEEAVKKSLQMGATDGVHVTDEALAGSDALSTALVLAEAVKKVDEVDLVLFGMSSTDGTMGVVPAMVAELLGVPMVTLANSVECSGGTGGTVTIKRDTAEATQTVEATLPAVVSVTDQINEPRYPSFKGIMAAKKKTVETWSLADLGVDPSLVGHGNAWAQVDDATKRPPREAGEIVTDEGDGGTKLAEFLAQRKFI